MNVSPGSRFPFCWRDGLPLLAFLIAGCAGYLYNVLGMFEFLPGDLGDARFNSVILEHLYRLFKGEVWLLSEPGFFYPFPRVMWFSDNHLGSGLFYVLSRSLGFGREHGFQIWFLIGNILNLVAGYVAARQLGLARFAAAATGFVFAFNLPAQAHEGFAQLTYRFPIPLAALALHQVLTSGDVRKLKWVLALLCWQIVISVYLGVFLIYLLIAICVAHWWVTKVSPIRGAVRGWRALSTSEQLASGAWGLLCLVPTGWLMSQYQATTKFYGFFRPASEIDSMTPRLSSYILADGAELSGILGRWLVHDLPMRHEHQMFFGFGIVALLLAGLLLKRVHKVDQQLKVLVGTSLFVLVLMTLRVGDFSVYTLFRNVSGFNAIRAVARVCEAMAWPVALLCGFGVAAVMDRLACHKKLWRALAALGLFCLVVVESALYQPTRFKVVEWQTRTDSARQALPETVPADAILFIPSRPDEAFFLAELDAAMLAQDLNIVTVNGYSGNATPGVVYPAPCGAGHDRLDAYVRFKKLSTDEALALHRRLLRPMSIPCVNR